MIGGLTRWTPEASNLFYVEYRWHKTPYRILSAGPTALFGDDVLVVRGGMRVVPEVFPKNGNNGLSATNIDKRIGFLKPDRLSPLLQ